MARAQGQTGTTRQAAGELHATRTPANRSTEVDEPTSREAISHFAGSVTVITTTQEGRPAGMTASVVVSPPFDPMLPLVRMSSLVGIAPVQIENETR